MASNIITTTKFTTLAIPLISAISPFTLAIPPTPPRLFQTPKMAFSKSNAILKKSTFPICAAVNGDYIEPERYNVELRVVRFRILDLLSITKGISDDISSLKEDATFVELELSKEHFPLSPTPLLPISPHQQLRDIEEKLSALSQKPLSASIDHLMKKMFAEILEVNQTLEYVENDYSRIKELTCLKLLFLIEHQDKVKVDFLKNILGSLTEEGKKEMMLECTLTLSQLGKLFEAIIQAKQITRSVMTSFLDCLTWIESDL